MLNAILFIADAQLAALVKTIASTSNDFAVESTVELTRTGYPLRAVVQTTRPDVLLLELTDLDRDIPEAATIRSQFPDLPLVGLTSRTLQPSLGLRSDRVLTSIAVWPFNTAELEKAISDALHAFHGGTYKNLVAFLPGKAGSGASTVVLHSARMVAQELGQKVLVMEADLHSGLLSAMLQVEPRLSIRDALAEAPRVDNLNWQRYPTAADGVDFLLANTLAKDPVPSWTHYFQMLRFVAPKYDLVMVDLPEVINSATAEAVRTARAVYVVSTPEFGSLKLSTQRCRELTNWGVDRDRIGVLLNRGHKNDINAKDAEQILDRPVIATFPNDYKSLRTEITDGRLIDKRSDLGKAYLAFSKLLTAR